MFKFTAYLPSKRGVFAARSIRMEAGRNFENFVINQFLTYIGSLIAQKIRNFVYLKFLSKTTIYTQK